MTDQAPFDQDSMSGDRAAPDGGADAAAPAASAPAEAGLDALLDRAIDAVQADTPADAVVTAAGQRAWARISADAAIGAAGETAYRELIPDYLAGRLSPAQALLVADHIREDARFRAEVEAARTGVAPRPLSAVAPVAAAPRGGTAVPWWRRWAWSLAAAAAVVGAFLVARDVLQPDRVLAQVAEVDGGLVEVAAAMGSRPLAAGDAVRPRQRLRAARDGGALVTLNDGTTIELGPRAELALAARWNGLAVELDRGDIIVHAAEQGHHRLHVATDDLDAAVKGTIFSVRRGTKGSRVSVIAGEVEVAGAQGRQTLAPGMQYSSRPAVGAVPVAEDVAWSRHSAEYLRILAELEALGRTIDATVDRPAPRRGSTLVDAVPADTVVFVALPNLGQTVAESYDRFKAGVAENPILADWWSRGLDDPAAMAFLDALVAAMADLSRGIGDEIVVTAGVDAAGTITPPAVMARVADPEAFRTLLEAKLAALAADLPADADELHDGFPVLIVTDRAALAAEVEAERAAGAAPGGPAAAGERLVVWLGDGLLVASPSAVRVETMLAGPRGLPAELGAAIAAGYAGGVDALLAIDVQRVTTAARAAQATGPEGPPAAVDGSADGLPGTAPDGPADAGGTDDDQALALSALAGARYAVATQVTADGRSQIEASLTFGEGRQGMAGWLGAPGPMGALELVSPSAMAVGAALIDRPERVVAEFLGLARSADPELSEEPDAVLGAEILADLARPLGGEVAFALDGPLLPMPAWKMVVEVTDPGALQAAIERAVARLNDRLDDPASRRLALASTELDGRPSWTLTLQGADDTSGVPVMHWLYADGYLVAAPDPGLLAAALRTRASGVSLRRSDAFVAALPTGAETDFSAVVWQDLGRLTRAVAGAAPAAAGEGSAEGALPGPVGAPDLTVMHDLAARLTPSLVYAWAEPDRLRLAASSEASPFGLGLLLRLLGAAGADGGPRPSGPLLDGIPMPFDGSPPWGPGS